MSVYIKDALKRRNLSQRTLAERLQMHPVSLSSHVNGNPSVAVLERIAEAIGDGCTTAELVTPPEIWASPSAPVLRCPHCGEVFAIEVK